MRDYAKLADQTTQIAALTVGGSVTLSGPWIAQPQQGYGDQRISGDLGGIAAIAPRIIFRVVEMTGQSLQGLTAQLQWQEQSINGSADPVVQTEDVTGDLLLGGGRLQFDTGDLGISQFSVVLTLQTGASLTLLCRVEVWGVFAPHRAPAQVQDTQGFGYGGVYAVNGVPNPLLTRSARKVEQPNLGALVDPIPETPEWLQE
jgi:hypothetical protein